MLDSLSSSWLFLGLVFFAVFLLVQGMVVPVFGEATRMRKHLLARLSNVSITGQQDFASLLRERHLTELSPIERRLEALPGFARFARLIEQSGRSTAVYRVVALSLVLAGTSAVFTWTMTRQPTWAAMLALAAGSLPYIIILRSRTRRMAKFEEQMPEALDVVKRALKAGHPFSQALKLVAEDMQDPIGNEFDLVFSEINYGGDLRHALLGLLERVPSVTVMAVVTAVLVQKETGGNLAETFERIAAVIRGRFKLHRRVRTLSAEGRLSAWILALVPLVLFVAMSITSPDYLPHLLKDPMGKNLIAASVVMGIIGILWIRRILRIQV
jgi:tight adherence protein B